MHSAENLAIHLKLDFQLNLFGWRKTQCVCIFSTDNEVKVLPASAIIAIVILIYNSGFINLNTHKNEVIKITGRYRNKNAQINNLD